MSLVTVITPTYNRAHLLGNLFESLQRQNSRNFEWLIVDDGSTDNTEYVVQRFTESADFSVRYLRKQNGGKHTALNFGIASIDTVLTFIVDSDDTVLPEGIAVIEQFYDKYKDVEGIGFFAFLKSSMSNGTVLKMPKDEFVGSYIEERIRKNRPGDMAEVFLTKALREFPFPEFPGERFLSEDVVWIPMGMKYKTVFINIPIYQFEYLDDGLTKNDKRHKFQSPLGSMMRGKLLMTRQCGFIANVRGAILYDCYRSCLDGTIPDLLKLELGYRFFLALVMRPLGAVFEKRWRKS